MTQTNLRGQRVLMVSSLAAFLLAACADTHELVRGDASPTITLGQGDYFYVAVSKDGVYGQQTYVGSGTMATNAVRATLAARSAKVATATAPQSLDEALGHARGNGFTYLIYPTILHWEDRATEWSGIPDQVAVKIEVVEVATGKTIDSAVIKGKSGLATFGGDHPQDLLPIPIEDYFKALLK